MLAFAVMPAVIFSIADGVRRYHRVVAERDAAFFQSASVEAQGARDAFVALQTAAQILSVNPDVADFSQPFCDAALGRAARSEPSFQLVVALDAAGSIRCSSVDLPGEASLADDPDFQRMAADPRFALSVRAHGRITGQEVLVGAAPILRGEGDAATFAGVVSISVNVASLRFLASQGQDAAARPLRAVVNARGEALVNTGAYGDAEGWLPAEGLPDNLGPETRTFVSQSLDGETRVYGVAPFVRDRAWLLAGGERSAVTDDAVLRSMPAIVAPLLMLAIAVGVAYFALDQLVVRHLVYLSRLARAYGRGKFDLRPKAAETAPQEIASLAESMTAMAENLAVREGELRESAETNRVLLMEVYHRVRNNLQLIESLLNLQMRRAGGAAERLTLERARLRVHSLALVHEKLYEADTVDRLDLGALLEAIARTLVETGAPRAAKGAGMRVRLSADVAPAVESPERATPLALFANEALLNAMENAAHPSGEAEIALSFRAGPHGAFTLRIENDAVSAAADAAEGALGGKLMEGFARQLRATLTTGRRGDRYVVELVSDRTAQPVAA